MKMQVSVKVLGMKASKGTMDNGQAFDSTKVYVETQMDESKGNAKGFAVAEYGFGQSDTFEKFKHLSFPFDATGEIEITTNGKTQKILMVSLKPIASPSVPQKA